MKSNPMMIMFSAGILVLAFLFGFVDSPVQAQADAPTPTPTPGVIGQIISVEPGEFYNNYDRQVVIVLVSQSQPFSASLGGTPVSIDSWSGKSSTQQLEVIATVPKDFTPGTYLLEVQMISGEVLKSTQSVTILAAVEAKVESISPDRVLAYGKEAQIFTITGVGLSNIARINYQIPQKVGSAVGECSLNGTDCILKTQNDDTIVISLSPSRTSLLWPDRENKFFLIEKDAIDPSTEQGDQSSVTFKSEDRIAPWHWRSWVGMILVTLTSLIFFSGSLRDEIKNTQKSVIQARIPKTASPADPDLVEKLIAEDPIHPWDFTFKMGQFVFYLSLFFIGIAFADLTFGIFPDDDSLRFTIIADIAALNVGLCAGYNFIFADEFKRFPYWARISLFLTGILGLAAPFILNALKLYDYAVMVQIGLLLATFVMGTVGLLYTRSLYPADEVILAKIEEILFQKDQVTLKPDLDNFPQRRARRLLQSYYQNNAAEEGLTYDERWSSIKLNTRVSELATKIDHLLDERGLVTIEDDLAGFPRGLARKVLKRYYKDRKTQGDLDFKDNRLVLTGQVNQQLVTSLEQLLLRQGRAAAEDFPGVGRARLLRAMSSYYTSQREELDLTYNEAAASLALGRGEAITRLQACAQRALNLLEEASPDPARLTDSLYELMVNIWVPFGFGEGAPYKLQKPPEGFRLFSTMPSDLASILPDPFPIFVMLSRQVISDAQVKALKASLVSLAMKRRFALLLDLSEGGATREVVQRKLVQGAQENIAVLTTGELTAMLARRVPVRVALMEALQKQVDLSLLSPYHTDGPVSADMFFGRADEIRLAVNAIGEHSVSILGARRIGKTSLLREIKRILAERGKVLLDLNCDGLVNYDSFFAGMETKWETSRLAGMTCQAITDFPRLVNRLQELNPGRQIIFQFDEIDRLLRFDGEQKGNSEVLFRMFRSLSQEGRCQFIFSGERWILDQLRNPISSFFNFTREIRLGVLDKATAKRLVTEPMRLMGVHVSAPDETTNLVYAVTDGHPNLIQQLCDMCLNELSEDPSRTTRILTEKLVKDCARKSEFRDLYIAIIFSQATPLEKALVICVMQAGSLNQSQALAELKKAGFKASISQVQRGFDYLLLTQALVSQDGRYSLRSQQFADCLAYNPPQQWLESMLLEESQKI